MQRSAKGAYRERVADEEAREVELLRRGGRLVLVHNVLGQRGEVVPVCVCEVMGK